MAYDVDKFTDKELERLEARIQREYKAAWGDMSQEAKKYMAEFKGRYKAEYKAFQEGKYTEAEFKAWYYAQVGRGEHWKTLKSKMADRLNKSAEITQGYVNGKLPTIYVKNNNAVASIAKKAAMDKGVTGINFELVDEHTVKRLMAGGRDVRPYKQIEINLPRQYTWNLEKLQNALLQGVLQGDSIDKLANRFMGVTDLNRAQAVRNARTSVTGAQSAGKQDRYDDLAEQGVIFTKIWVATSDERTREAHAEADGQEVDYDEYFEVDGEELLYPGDVNGSPGNIYNCRCTMHTGTPRFISKLTPEMQERANIRVR